MAILPVCTWPSFLSKVGHPSCQHGVHPSCLHVVISPVYAWPFFLSTHDHRSCLHMAIHPIYKKPSYLSTGGHLPSILSTVAILKLYQVAIIPVNKWPSFPVYYCPPFLSSHGRYGTLLYLSEVQVTICLNLICLCLKYVLNRKPVMGTKCE